MPMGLEEHMPEGFLLTTVEKVSGYARKSSVWPAAFGLACYAMELIATGGPPARLRPARHGGYPQHPAAG